MRKLKSRKRKVDNELCGGCGFIYGNADDPLIVIHGKPVSLAKSGFMNLVVNL